MANLSTDNVEAQKQVLAAIKTGMETFPMKMGVIHTRDRYAPNPNAYKELLEYVDTEHGNETIMRGAFIIFQGPDASDSGTINCTPPECSYKILIVWQFEDERADGSNSSEEFADMLMYFYDYFEQNHHLGLRGLNIQAPKLVTKAQVADYDGVICHVVEFELKCSLYGR